MVLGVGGLKGTQIIKVQSSLRDRKLSSVHTFVDASNNSCGAVSYLR